MSFKKFRIIDLTILLVLGIITECLGTYLSIKVVSVEYYNPYFVVALGLICLAITRHGLIGGISIPVYALANTITYTIAHIYGGSSFASTYYVIRGIVCLISMLTPLLLIFFYRNGTNSYLKNYNKLFEVTSIVALLAIMVVFVSNVVVSLIAGVSLTFGLIWKSMLAAIIYEAIGIIAMFLINSILYREKVFTNCYESFVEQRLEKENENDYYNVRNNNTVESDSTDTKGL